MHKFVAISQLEFGHLNCVEKMLLESMGPLNQGNFGQYHRYNILSPRQQMLTKQTEFYLVPEEHLPCSAKQKNISCTQDIMHGYVETTFCTNNQS